jgi:nucleoside-diphosphate-sugar epimerase
MSNVALLTGITGFIGRNLANKLLNHGWEIHAIIREESNLSNLGNLKNNCSFHTHDGSIESMIGIHKKLKIDVVFHLASLYLANHKAEEVSELITSNIQFSTQLLEGMLEGGSKKIINVGSYAQHNDSEEFNPFNLYSSTKEAFQNILYFYHLAHGLSCLNLKLFDTYGLGDTRGKLINLITDSLLEGSNLELSPGDQLIDLSHVDDVVKHFLKAEEYLSNLNEEPSWQVFFVSGERLTVKELVINLEKIVGRKFRGSFGKRLYRDREIMNPVLSSKELPWEKKVHKISLKEGVSILMES